MGWFSKSQSADVPQVSPLEGERLLGSGALLLDVREPDEWVAGHAPQARHVPLGQLAEVARDLNPDRTFVVTCRSGNRSQKAANSLRGWGFEAVNLAGGMEPWKEAGLPVVTDDGREGRVA